MIAWLYHIPAVRYRLACVLLWQAALAVVFVLRWH